MEFLGKLFKSWRLFTSTSCKKSEFDHFHLKMWNFRVHPTPNFLVRDLHPKILVNLDHVLLVVREKIENETVATFYDVCGVFGSRNDSFSIFSSRMKVINIFKAQKVTFREGKSQKVGNWPFWLHLDPNFLERDETRFLTFCIPKPCANQCFFGTFGST